MRADNFAMDTRECQRKFFLRRRTPSAAKDYPQLWHLTQITKETCSLRRYEGCTGRLPAARFRKRELFLGEGHLPSVF